MRIYSLTGFGEGPHSLIPYEDQGDDLKRAALGIGGGLQWL